GGHEEAPEQRVPAADGEQHQRQRQRRQVAELLQQEELRKCRQVLHPRLVDLLALGVPLHDPADVRVPETAQDRRVHVAFLVGVLVVPAVVGRPPEDALLRGGVGQDRHHQLERPRGLERPVREIAVVRDADPDHARDVEAERERQPAPGEAAHGHADDRDQMDAPARPALGMEEPARGGMVGARGVHEFTLRPPSSGVSQTSVRNPSQLRHPAHMRAVVLGSGAEEVSVKYRQLGGSGLKVSELCLGAMTFGEADAQSFMHGIGADQETSFAIMNRALDAGCNFFDTADVYGQDGLSERVIGAWFERDKRRDEVVLATKFRFTMGSGPNRSGASRYRIVRCCEDSLRRLATDRIDLYQVHCPDLSTPEEETLRALDDLVSAGKVLYIGCSNYQAHRMTESWWLSQTQHLA